MSEYAHTETDCRQMQVKLNFSFPRERVRV